MMNKIVTIILFVGLSVSLAGNAYSYLMIHRIHGALDNRQTSIQLLESRVNLLESATSDSTNSLRIRALSAEIMSLQSEIKDIKFKLNISLHDQMGL